MKGVSARLCSVMAQSIAPTLPSCSLARVSWVSGGRLVMAVLSVKNCMSSVALPSGPGWVGGLWGTPLTSLMRCQSALGLVREFNPVTQSFQD